MFLSPIDLTTALRPSLLPDETLLFVQDAVGLYEGKYKLDGYQNGHAYLTTHRACYIDNEEPRKRAVAINLKDVDRSEFYAGFLKSSAKVTLFAKTSRNISLTPRLPTPSQSSFEADSSTSRSTPSINTSSSAAALTNATWICPICTFSNPVPSNFDPVLANDNTVLPPCLACGIKPPLNHVVKAAVSSLANRPLANTPPRGQGLAQYPRPSPAGEEASSVICPRCTFQNDASLPSCEMCGASLGTPATAFNHNRPIERYDSPGPVSGTPGQLSESLDSVKFSFRAGGDKIFHERLKNALIQRKWLLQSAPAAPRNGANGNTNSIGPSPSSKAANIGIAGLERRGSELRRNNEVVIGNAFEDLAALMASAKEIIAVAEQFASQTKPSGGDAGSTSGYSSPASDPALLLAQMNQSTTREMLAPGGGSNSAGANSLYLTQLSRQVAEQLTDDRTGILRSEGGIISLVDLWAVFNRARGGVELVSPTDFADAVGLFERLQLPVRLRRFKSGLLVVQGRDRTDEKTVAAILGWLKSLHGGIDVPPRETTTAYSDDDIEDPVDGYLWGRGVTALEAADHFGWSVGVATEELEMAEERGAVCREVGLEGVRFWENWFVVPGSAHAHLRKAT